jgi:hypothetical protein
MDFTSLEAYWQSKKIKDLQQLNHEIEVELQQREKLEYQSRVRDSRINARRPSFLPNKELEIKQEGLCLEIIAELKQRFPSFFYLLELDFPITTLEQMGYQYWSSLDKLDTVSQTLIKTIISRHQLRPYNVLVLSGCLLNESRPPKLQIEGAFQKTLTQTIFLHPTLIEGQPESDAFFKLPREALKFFGQYGLPEWAIYRLYTPIENES